MIKWNKSLIFSCTLLIASQTTTQNNILQKWKENQIIFKYENVFDVFRKSESKVDWLKNFFQHQETFFLVEKDMEQLVEKLKQHYSSAEINKIEKQVKNSLTINRYNEIVGGKPVDLRDVKSRVFLFNIANRFFEFCYNNKTTEQFRKLFAEEKYHPIIRLLHSIIWKQLSSDGWAHWHFECLKNLRTSYNKNKEVVYIAGGNDIYQLLNFGIYNIKIRTCPISQNK